MDAFATGGPAILRAYNANDLSKPLYSSDQAGPRNTAGGGVKFITPTIANGMVYLGTQFEVDVYGLLPQAGGASIASAPQVSGNGALTIKPPAPQVSGNGAFTIKPAAPLVGGKGDPTINPADPPSSGAMARAGGGRQTFMPRRGALGSGGGLNGPGALSDQEAMNEVVMSLAGSAKLFAASRPAAKKKTS